MLFQYPKTGIRWSVSEVVARFIQNSADEPAFGRYIGSRTTSKVLSNSASASSSRTDTSAVCTLGIFSVTRASEFAAHVHRREVAAFKP